MGEIIFRSTGEERDWVMKITHEGILFNMKRFPDETMEGFAKGVIDILERCYTVKFMKNKLPYDNE